MGPQPPNLREVQRKCQTTKTLTSGLSLWPLDSSKLNYGNYADPQIKPALILLRDYMQVQCADMCGIFQHLCNLCHNYVRVCNSKVICGLATFRGCPGVGIMLLAVLMTSASQTNINNTSLCLFNKIMTNRNVMLCSKWYFTSYVKISIVLKQMKCAHALQNAFRKKRAIESISIIMVNQWHIRTFIHVP